MKIKLRKQNDFWGLIRPDEASNSPIITLNHLNPEVEIDETKLPEWAIEVIKKSVNYGILIVKEDEKKQEESVATEEKKETQNETVVESTVEKPAKEKKTRAKAAPKKSPLKKAVITQ